MKYTLTIESDNKEDIVKILNGETTLTGAHVTAALEDAPAQEKKSRSKKKEADVMADVTLPEAPKAPATIFPAEALTPQQPAFDRNLAITHITSTLKDLPAKGIAGPKISGAMNNIYNTLKIPPQKIYDLTDAQLMSFMPLFQAEINNLIESPAPQSFI